MTTINNTKIDLQEKKMGKNVNIVTSIHSTKSAWFHVKKEKYFSLIIFVIVVVWFLFTLWCSSSYNCIKYVSSVNALEKIIVVQDDEIFDHFFLNEILVTYEIQSALLDTR